MLVFFSQHNVRHVSAIQGLDEVPGSRDLKADTKVGPDGFEAFLNIDYVQAMNHSLLRKDSKHTTRLWSWHLFYSRTDTKAVGFP